LNRVSIVIQNCSVARDDRECGRGRAI